MTDSVPLPQIAQAATALGVGGVITAVLGHLLGWRKTRAEIAKVQTDSQVALQTLVDERLKTLLSADETRLRQMSEALESQNRLIEEFRTTIQDQTERVSRLENTVKMLVRHIANLENILRSRSIDFPARPEFGDIGGKAVR